MRVLCNNEQKLLPRLGGTWPLQGASRRLDGGYVEQKRLMQAVHDNARNSNMQSRQVPFILIFRRKIIFMMVIVS